MGLKKIYFFGSYARGETDETSDVDLVYGTYKNMLKFYVIFDKLKKMRPIYSIYYFNRQYEKNILI